MSETSKRLSEHRPSTAAEIREFVDARRYDPGYPSDCVDVANALEATLLFHSGPPWDEEKAKRWHELTGTYESTTRNLCDFIRSALK